GPGLFPGIRAGGVPDGHHHHRRWGGHARRVPVARRAEDADPPDLARLCPSVPHHRRRSLAPARRSVLSLGRTPHTPQLRLLAVEPSWRNPILPWTWVVCTFLGRVCSRMARNNLVK